MGIPDQEEFLQPTVQQGWIHTMTSPRELSYRSGHLYQQPARELTQLRGTQTSWQGIANEAPLLPAQSAELQLSSSGPFCLNLLDALTLSWDGERLTLSRPNLRTGELEQRFWRGELQQLRLLCDHSSVELFINEGEAVMSARYFPQGKVSFSLMGPAEVELQHWPLARCVVE